MRRRRICYVGALGLALAVSIPATAMASGIQNAELGFSPQRNANISFPAPTVNLSNKYSKNGTTRNLFFLSDIVGQPPSLETQDIHSPEEVRYNTKGLDECDPASIAGVTTEQARATCAKAEVGRGGSSLFGISGQGSVTLFNGTKRNGNPTVLFHSVVGATPPVTLVSEMRDSPLPGYGTLFHTPISTTVGGAVPPGIVIETTDYTAGRNYTDEKLAEKAKKLKKRAKKASGSTAKKLNKKAKKLKQKSKKSWIQAKCTDGELKSQVDFIHAAPDPSQSVTDTQACTS